MQIRAFDVCKDETCFVQTSPPRPHSIWFLFQRHIQREQPRGIRFLFSCGSKAELQPRQPHFFYVSRSHTAPHTAPHTHTVDMTPPNTSSAHCKGRYLHNTHTRDEHHAVSGIRTRVSSTLGVAYLRVKLHGHQDRHRVLDDEIRRPLCLSPLGWQYSK